VRINNVGSELNLDSNILMMLSSLDFCYLDRSNINGVRSL
jgi:hypothetical protein